VVKQAIRASVTAFIIATALYANVAGAHGNVAIEQDSCMRRAGSSMVHLSVYQPKIEPKAHYCTDIPHEGETFLVVDLVDAALRDMPVSMRIVKGTDEENGETIKIVKPIYHPDGVVAESVFLEKGRYTVMIKGDGVPPVEYEYPLRVQMINYSEVFKKAIGPTIAFLVLIFIGYKITKTKKVQKWLASKRS
tara:strand:+ start:236 stop:811 length:576 start_codon:yes stop_codon:yes gene_type:complete